LRGENINFVEEKNKWKQNKKIEFCTLQSSPIDHVRSFKSWTWSHVALKTTSSSKLKSQKFKTTLHLKVNNWNHVPNLEDDSHGTGSELWVTMNSPRRSFQIPKMTSSLCWSLAPWSSQWPAVELESPSFFQSCIYDIYIYTHDIA
jgi:hypothetical protein